jgi:methyl-accepting chemotaxis protein
MTSTQPQLPSSDPQLTPPRPKKIGLKSVGSRLFLAVMSGALVGLGGTSYFFYQNARHHAEDEVQSILQEKVSAIENQLTQAETATEGLAAATKNLRELGIKDPQAYKKIALEFFRKRPQISMAASVGQTPYGLASDRKWFWPYIYADQGSPDQKGEKLAAPDQNAIYSELFKDDNYPAQTYYEGSVTSVIDRLWLEPYQWYGITITSLMIPVRNQANKVIGFANMDVNVTALADQAKGSVFDNSGHFAILSRDGHLLAYPPAAEKAAKHVSYKEVSELNKIWPQIWEGESGLIRADGQLWAYERVAGTKWIMLAVVPENVILGPILNITLLGSLGAGLVLAGTVLWFMRRLNRSLQPMLDECYKLSSLDAETQAKLQNQDEVEQLSTSFFNLIGQISDNEAQIRQESAARVAEAEARLKLANEIEEQSQTLQTEIGSILDAVMSAEAGDLTVQAPVSEGATGLVADTLNRLIEELAKVMSAVNYTAQQVTQGASELETLAVNTVDQIQQQTQSMTQVQNLMTQVNDLSQDTAEQAIAADAALKQAQTAVSQGQQEMMSMAQGITVLNDGTQQIIRRVDILNNFVELAAQFAGDQKRVAALTRVLALNASMIAARASKEQDPQQFMSIAREFETIATQVNNLAAETNQSLQVLQQRTDQIQTVVSGVNEDVQEISSSVSQFTQSVSQSRQVFEQIKSVTEQVVQVGQQVTQSSQAIAQAAQTTLNSVEEMATVVSETEEQSRFTRQQAGWMDQLAQILLERVQFFRLAEQPAEQLIEIAPELRALPVISERQLGESVKTHTNGHKQATHV